MQLTYKTALVSGKPYNSLPGDEYLALLRKSERAIYEGTFGVYLARKVIVESQELYQPLIDIDGDPALEGLPYIESAIQFAQTTLGVLSELGAEGYFKFLATGGTGFRAVSNLLLNRQAYLALIDWLRRHMPHIHDLKPTIETDIPHQLLAYKGIDLQNTKVLIDGHSTVISRNLLKQGAFTIDDYREATAGKPDPAEIISFVKWLLAGPVISDLKALGPFGKQIEAYQRFSSEFRVNPFSYVQLRKQTKPIGIDVMQAMLSDRGIASKVENRGRNLAISFTGLPCPVCGKITANARAYPPSYTLRCFNSNCGAYNGMPLAKWAEIKNSADSSPSNHNGFDLSTPENHVSLEEARQLIASELENQDDSLFVLTPGVGKTQTTLEALTDIRKDRVVIYAAFNRALQKEAFDKVCQLAGGDDGFHLLQPREKTCLRQDELKEITTRGYSPSELLCAGCEYRGSTCKYYDQRRDFGPGVYFVTLHMLQYLQDKIQNPDLIILDENLKAGLMLEETCTELQIMSLLKVVDGADAILIRHLLSVMHSLSTNLVGEGGHALIINGRKLTESDFQETTIIELLAREMDCPEEEVHRRLTTISNTLNSLSRIDLYRREIDLNAIVWIKGLLSPSALSFVHISRNGAIKFGLKRITPLGYHGTPVKILDATGDARALKPLVGRTLKTIRADVAWNSKRVHIKLNTSRKIMAHATEPGLRKLLSEMLSHTDAQKIMVYTYKRHKKAILDILKNIDPAREYMDYHFMGPRGINNYQECDAVLVIGMPYPNLNSAAQDACILFPDRKDAEKRMDWAEACMQWDLVQGIHRIRPVHKSSVDIVMAASNWPSMLPAPDIVIDRSQNANWKDLAIIRLKPFVETFGFLNQDIGFLANVYVDKKKSIAKQFQENMAKVICAISKHIPELKGNSITSQLGCKEEFYTFGYDCFKDVGESLAEEKFKLILVIIYLYIQNSLRQKNFIVEIIDLLEKQTIDWTNDDLILSNTNQWAELIIHFKEEYPHFEKFQIKLPHAHWNYVTGVGNAERVKSFYYQLHHLGIVGIIDVDSYRVAEQSACQVNPIPDGLLSIYVADNGERAFVCWESEFEAISLRQEPELLRSSFEGLLKDPQTKIITNNGKAVAKFLRKYGLLHCEIIDVVIAEKLIANGEVAYRCLDLKSVFKRHGLAEDLERSSVVHRLEEVWGKQEGLIDVGGLGAVFDLESKVIWVTGKIESAGIEIDVDALVRRHDWLTARSNSLIAQLREAIPDDISLNDRIKVKEYLNSTFALSLAKIDEEAVGSISNAAAADLIRNLLNYWKTSRELRQVELYMSLTGRDDRVQDSIDQLNTKTGRFYRQLQTVEKEGAMRSLFRAKKGYKFIVADYSQQEARIIAGLSGDKTAIDLFKAGKDIYLETAKLLIGDHTDSPLYRALGKEIVLGLNNGRAAYSIHECLARMGFGYDLDDVMGMILRYDMTFPGIKAWRDAIVKSAHENGFIATKLGRTLKVSKDTNENSLYNYPVQGTAADGFKRALLELDGQLAGLDARIVHILHDEVIVEVKEGIVDTVAGIVKECMEEAFKKSLPAVPFSVEPEVRNSWG